MKPFFIPALLAFSVSVAQAQDAAPLLISQVALRAKSPRDFVPRGWKIEKRVGGDLNRDKVPDAALVLVENEPADADGTNRGRALVVLLQEGKNWWRVGFNNSLLLGTHDGGAFYGESETPVDVSIKRGVLLVQQESGSRDVLDTTHRFRFDGRRNGLMLIGFDSIDHDRVNGDVLNTSANFLTGLQKTQTMKGDKDAVRTATKRVSRKLRPLESIRVDERYAN